MLFVTWDGAAQNYMESLFLPILQRAQAGGDFEFDVLQWTWASEAQVVSTGQAAARAGIGYTRLPVFRWGGGAFAAATMSAGAALLARRIRRESIDVVLPRSTLPAGMALLARRLGARARFVFDADGLPIDERVEAGLLQEGSLPCRVLRAVEGAAVRRADAVVVRTERAREVLSKRSSLPGGSLGKFHVIPNGKDTERYSPGNEAERAAARRELGIPIDCPLVAYVGSVGPQYLPEASIRLFSEIVRRRPDARLLALTGQEMQVQALADKFDLAPSVTAMRVPPGRVPDLLRAADVGLALRRPSLSQLGVSPIKVGEYLLCGVPLVATRGVGDLDDQINPGSGLVMESVDLPALEAAADYVLGEFLPRREEFRRSCRANGLRYFSLDECARSLCVALGAEECHA